MTTSPQMNNSPFEPQIRFNLGGALLLATLVTALLTMLSGLAIRFVPGWQMWFLVGACFVVAIEAALVQYRMRRDNFLIPSALSYLSAEIFALVVLMRIVASLSVGLDQLRPSLQDWIESPLSALDIPFSICLLCGLFAALIARSGLRALNTLEPRSQALITDSSLDAAFYRAAIETNKRLTVARIGSMLTWGGVASLAALVGQVINFEAMGAAPLRLDPLIGLAGIAYLLCAVLLYSRARLGLMFSRWQLDDATVDPAVKGSWGRLNLALVAGLTLLTLFLPRSYGLSLLDLARSSGVLLLNIIALIMLNLGVISVGLLGILLIIPALILSWFGTSTNQPPVAPPPTPPVFTPQANGLERGAPPLLPALIFWACIAVLAIYALIVVGRRQAWVRSLAQRLNDRFLHRIWETMLRAWRRTRSYAHKVSEALAERMQRPEAEPAARRAFVSLRRLDPRELVRYFYVSTLQRAARRGIGRQRSQTPYEYGRRLGEDIPEAKAEITELTEAYIAAAYGPHPVSRAEAGRARRPWERLRRLLRSRPAPPSPPSREHQ